MTCILRLEKTNWGQASSKDVMLEEASIFYPNKILHFTTALLYAIIWGSCFSRLEFFFASKPHQNHYTFSVLLSGTWIYELVGTFEKLVSGYWQELQVQIFHPPRSPVVSALPRPKFQIQGNKQIILNVIRYRKTQSYWLPHSQHILVFYFPFLTFVLPV